VKNSPIQIAPTTHEIRETHRNDHLNTSSGPLSSTKSVFADSGRHTATKMAKKTPLNIIKIRMKHMELIENVS
jgi:hypothetical protein